MRVYVPPETFQHWEATKTIKLILLYTCQVFVTFLKCKCYYLHMSTYVAVCCNVWQRVAVWRCCIVYTYHPPSYISSPVVGPACVAVCCSVVAVWCSVFQCVAVCGSVLQCVYTPLRHEKSCCRTCLCCSVLQCFAVCGSVLQWLHTPFSSSSGCQTRKIIPWDLLVLQRVAV